MDPATGQKARGLKVDVAETLQGTVLQVENPNAPPPVSELQVEDLKAMLDSGEPVNLFDVRGPDELECARIDGARPLDDETMVAIDALPKDAPMVFLCHHGQRSQGAAEHFRLRGHRRVYNLVGGIDAWSQRVDPGVPRY
jgi:monothiol glutaredoxin